MSDLADLTTISKIGPTNSAIAQFPNELLGEIFFISTATPLRVPPPLQDSDLPWAFLRVSKTWREVALGTPNLWNDIYLDYDLGGRVWEGFDGMVEARYMLERTVAAEKILERTKDSSISLEIRLRSYYDSEKWMSRIFSLVISASTSIKSLTIHLTFDQIDALFQLGDIHFPALECIAIDDGHAVNAIDMSEFMTGKYQISLLKNTPRLRKLVLGANIPWRENTTTVNWAQLTDLTLHVTRLPVEEAHIMLRLCPNIVSLRITPGTLTNRNTQVDNPVHLPLLTNLAVEFWASDEVPIFLLPLVVPRLQHLSITYIYIILEPGVDARLIPIFS